MEFELSPRPQGAVFITVDVNIENDAAGEAPPKGSGHLINWTETTMTYWLS